MQGEIIQELLLDINNAPLSVQEELLSFKDKTLPGALYNLSNTALIDLWNWVADGLKDIKRLLNTEELYLPCQYFSLGEIEELVDLGSVEDLARALKDYSFLHPKKTLEEVLKNVIRYPDITLVAVHKSTFRSGGHSLSLISHNMRDGGTYVGVVIYPLWFVLTHKIVQTTFRQHPITLVDIEREVLNKARNL